MRNCSILKLSTKPLITVFNLTLYERRKDKYNKAQSKIPETHSALLNTPETPDTPFTARHMTQKLVRRIFFKVVRALLHINRFAILHAQ